jgi:hypothetical protein
MSRVPQMTSESGMNASGQEAFGSKMLGTPVVESPAALAPDVTSAAVGAGTTAASEADRVGTSAPPFAGGEGSDLGTSGPQAVPGPQSVMDEGTRSVDDQDRCLYVSTPWEAEVVTDRRDLDEFKEEACTIGRVLLVRALVNLLRFLLWVFECHEVEWPFSLTCSLLSNGASSNGSSAGSGERASRGRRSPRGEAAG